MGLGETLAIFFSAYPHQNSKIQNQNSSQTLLTINLPRKPLQTPWCAPKPPNKDRNGNQNKLKSISQQWCLQWFPPRLSQASWTWHSSLSLTVHKHRIKIRTHSSNLCSNSLPCRPPLMPVDVVMLRWNTIKVGQAYKLLYILDFTEAFKSLNHVQYIYM